MSPQLFHDTLWYVTGIPFFWMTMGMITASAMFCGAIILNGDLSMAWRSLLTKIIFVTLLFQVNFYRVTYEIQRLNISFNKYSYAEIVTMVIVSIFWIIGMLLGVYTSHGVKAHYRK